jgi:hypothetical protein
VREGSARYATEKKGSRWVRSGRDLPAATSLGCTSESARAAVPPAEPFAVRCRTIGAQAHRVTVPVLTFSCLIASLEADIHCSRKASCAQGRPGPLARRSIVNSQSRSRSRLFAISARRTTTGPVETHRGGRRTHGVTVKRRRGADTHGVHGRTRAHESLRRTSSQVTTIPILQDAPVHRGSLREKIRGYAVPYA